MANPEAGKVYIVTDGEGYRSQIFNEEEALNALSAERKEADGQRFPREENTWHIEIHKDNIGSSIPKEQLGFVFEN